MDIEQTAQTVVACIRSFRFSMTDEKRLQVEIAERFAARGIVAKREVRLSKADVVDFMIGGLAVEVKIKGARRAIFRQAERYCQHEAVHGLVLVTSVWMGMPPAINGKPVWMADLGRAWL